MIGTSYQPGAQAQPYGQARPNVTPQEAVRILSLRLPKNPQNSPIPGALLTSAGGGGANLTQLLQALMQAAGGGGKQMVSDAPVPAIDNGINETPRSFAPRIRPGDTGAQPAPAEPVAPPQEASPLFDQGTPPIRNWATRKPSWMGMDQPLF